MREIEVIENLATTAKKNSACNRGRSHRPLPGISGILHSALRARHDGLTKPGMSRTFERTIRSCSLAEAESRFLTGSKSMRSSALSP